MDNNHKYKKKTIIYDNNNHYNINKIYDNNNYYNRNKKYNNHYNKKYNNIKYGNNKNDIYYNNKSKYNYINKYNYNYYRDQNGNNFCKNYNNYDIHKTNKNYNDGNIYLNLNIKKYNYHDIFVIIVSYIPNFKKRLELLSYREDLSVYREREIMKYSGYIIKLEKHENIEKLKSLINPHNLKLSNIIFHNITSYNVYTIYNDIPKIINYELDNRKPINIKLHIKSLNGLDYLGSYIEKFNVKNLTIKLYKNNSTCINMLFYLVLDIEYLLETYNNIKIIDKNNNIINLIKNKNNYNFYYNDMIYYNTTNYDYITDLLDSLYKYSFEDPKL